MLRQAFNMLTRLNSRKSVLRRLGAAGDTPLETDIRLSSSNYARNLAVLSEMTVTGREFIIAQDSIVDKFDAPVIKRGDKIIDTLFGNMVITDIVEMTDLGGSIMGYRIRCE